MKTLFLSLFALLLTSAAWVNINKMALPASPSICMELSESVPLSFKINSLSPSNIELGLQGTNPAEQLFVRFKMSDTWKEGRLGVVMEAMKPVGMESKTPSAAAKGSKTSSKMTHQTQQKQRDLTVFTKDRRGKAVSQYTFVQTLVEGNDGKTYLKMTYEGPDVPMVEILEIHEPVNLPPYLSRKFLKSKQNLQFVPGQYGFDQKIQGFYLPVVAI